ncbi:MAG: hypothetical protein EOO61_12910 [Hymenobacter sp.]|nr:MAG: hypothetical protein EOO61_12910 [Hymenobacter sp.]
MTDAVRAVKTGKNDKKMNAQDIKKRKFKQEEPDFKQFDYVEVKVSRPKLGIKKGDKGAIMDV